MSLLGIDLGTSSVKVVLTLDDGTIQAGATAEYPVSRPQPGWAETDPQAWWSAIVSAVHRVLSTVPSEKPSAIGLSGQMHGVVLSDAAGVPVRPALLWADARADLSAYRSLPPEVLRRLANPLSPGMAGPELAWLHIHEPASVKAAKYALQPKDWVRARLTGEFAAEPSDASATLLYDVLTQSWSDSVVDSLGIQRGLLPDLLPHSGSEAGLLRREVAAELGLTCGIPVAAGAADTAAAALGSGLVSPGTVQLTIGTGVQIVTPVPTPSSRTLPDRPVTHLYRSATPTGWYAMAAGLTGGQTLDWVRRLLGADWPTLYAIAARGPLPGDPVFLPHLIGERTPYLDTQMRGAWAGLDARHDRDALLYSALEGVAFAVATGFGALSPGSEVEAGSEVEVRLAGGGTKTPAWRQLLADALGVPLHPVEVPDASARGAALLGAAALGGSVVATETGAGEAGAGEAGLGEIGLGKAGLSEIGLGEAVSPSPRATQLAERRALYQQTVDALRPLPFA